MRSFLVVFVLFVFLFLLFFVFAGFLFALHGDSSMDYVSILFSSPFDSHCRHDDVATALIR